MDYLTQRIFAEKIRRIRRKDALVNGCAWLAIAALVVCVGIAVYQWFAG